MGLGYCRRDQLLPSENLDSHATYRVYWESLVVERSRRTAAGDEGAGAEGSVHTLTISPEAGGPYRIGI